MPRAWGHLKEAGTTVAHPLGAGMTEMQPEQEKNGEKHPDLFPPSCPVTSQQGPHKQNYVKPTDRGAWESEQGRLKRNLRTDGSRSAEDALFGSKSVFEKLCCLAYG